MRPPTRLPHGGDGTSNSLALAEDRQTQHLLVYSIEVREEKDYWLVLVLRPRLLLGDVTDYRQLEHLSLISLERQNQQDHK